LNEHALLSNRYRIRFVAILFLVCLLNLADRAVFSVLAPLIRIDLHLSDTQIGMLQGLSFALLYGGLGIPVGRLAERRSRIGIIACATAIWSAATALSGMAGSYVQMVLARVGVGMGEAGFTAPTSSLVADHFPRERRASGMAMIMLGLPVGTLIGALGAGQIAQHWGWRTAFFAFGIPGLLVALLTWRGLTEPPRGLADGGKTHQGEVPPLRAVFAHLLRVPSLRWVVIGGAICSIGIQGVAQFMVLYLVRSFSLPIGKAGALFGIVSGLSLAVGLLMGALGTDRASLRDARWWVLGPAIALVLTAIAFNFGFRSPTLTTAIALIALGNVGAMVHYGPTIGLIQNLTPVNMRASASAVFAMLYALAGTGIGPTFVGYASDRFASGHFGAADYVGICRPGNVAQELVQSCGSAAKLGLIQSLSCVVLAYGVAALFYWLASKSVRKDLEQQYS
jgi:predicted MFS family arabinose efflux permease